MTSNPIIEQIQARLTEVLEPTHLTITPSDPNSTCGLMIRVFIVSPKFEGKRLLERQRVVNDILTKELANNTIHAIQFEKCLTPEQFQKLNETQ